MGTYIRTLLQRKVDGVWTDSHEDIFPTPAIKYREPDDMLSVPFDWQSYTVFGFLGNSWRQREVPPILSAAQALSPRFMQHISLLMALEGEWRIVFSFF